jgi:hypothetical protein
MKSAHDDLYHEKLLSCWSVVREMRTGCVKVGQNWSDIVRALGKEYPILLVTREVLPILSFG